jgi:hypothetical protein
MTKARRIRQAKLLHVYVKMVRYKNRKDILMNQRVRL